MLGHQPGIFWKICWVGICPICLLVLLLMKLQNSKVLNINTIFKEYILFLKRKVNAQIFIIAHVLRQISWNINLACMLLTDIVCVVVLEVWVANADGLCLPPVGCGPGLVHHRVLYHLYTCLWCLQIYHYSRYLETGKCLGRKKMMTVCIFCKIYVKFIKIVK